MSFDAPGTLPVTDDIYPVEDLTTTAMLTVAARIAVASGFTDLIYRESEVDALWSLADIAAKTAALAAAPDAADKARLRDEIARAHDLIPDDRCEEAAEILRAATVLIKPLRNGRRRRLSRRFYSPSLLAEAHAADQRIRRPRRASRAAAVRYASVRCGLGPRTGQKNPRTGPVGAVTLTARPASRL